MEGPEHVEGASRRLLFAVIAVVTLVIAGASTAILLQPTASSGLEIGVVSGKVTEANGAEIGLVVRMSLHNTDDKNITYYGGLFTLSDNGQQVGGGAFHDVAVVAPGQTRILNENISISLGDVVEVGSLNTQGTWRLQGTATVGIAGKNTTQGFDANFATA